MNIQKALTAFYQFDPKGYEELNNQLTAQMLEIAAPLTFGQAMFIKNNLAGLFDFLKTPQGRTLVQTFVEEWQASLKEKQNE